MATVLSINQMSLVCYSVPIQSTRSPPGPRLLKMIGDTHTHNYNLKGKEKDVHFFFVSVEELRYKLNFYDQKIRQILARDIWNNWRAVLTFLGFINLQCNLHRLCAICTCSSVVKFRLCILWSLTRSPVGETTVYTAEDT